MKKTLFTVLLIVAIALSVTVISCSSEVKAKSSENYITFSTKDNSKFTLTIPCVFDGDLYYSTDASTWKEVTATDTKEWDLTPTSCTDLTAENGKLYLKGNNTTITKNGNYGRAWRISATCGVSLSGNIMTLLNCDSPATEITGEKCFYSMFKNCTSLTDISGLTLQAKTIAQECYREMFYGCTGLTEVPEDLLPATTIANGCYSSMFQYCTSLTNAPALLAETLAVNCYGAMFYGCTSLVEAPELKATTLAASCYGSMFQYCTSLTAVPSLPATTLTKHCYMNMFYSCTSLTDVPENLLPATTLTDYCYSSMFFNCTSLKNAPELKATALAENCYCSMFTSCTSLKDAPVLTATDLAKSCYREMFRGCKSLENAPALQAETLAVACYYLMFNGCTSLKVSTNGTEDKKIFTCPNTSPIYSVTDMFEDIASDSDFKGTPTSGNTYYWYLNT